MNIAKIAIIASLSVVLLSGCATHEGFPCWSFEQDTDQKIAREMDELDKEFAIEINLPGETNGIDANAIMGTNICPPK